jgi:hypothetical protein
VQDSHKSWWDRVELQLASLPSSWRFASLSRW